MTVNTTYSYIKTKTTSDVIKIYINDILFVESSGRYCYIHHKNGLNFFRISIKELEDRYPNTFIRCNKQHLVPLKKISKVNIDIHPANVEIKVEDRVEVIDISYDKAQTISNLLEQEDKPKKIVSARQRQRWIVSYLKENKKTSALDERFVSEYLEMFDVKKLDSGFRVPKVPSLNYDLGRLIAQDKIIKHPENTDDKLILDGFPYRTWWFRLKSSND